MQQWKKIKKKESKGGRKKFQTLSSSRRDGEGPEDPKGMTPE